MDERAHGIALAAAGVSVWVWDTDGETCRVTGGALVGLPADVSLSRDDLLARVAPDDRDTISRALRELPVRGRIDVRFRVSPDGGERWLQLRGWREGDGGVVAACTDVSDEVHVRELELRRRQVVIRQNQALRRMAGRLVDSTDLGTMLTASCTDIAHALEVARVGVWIFDEDDQNLRCLTRVASGAGIVVPGETIEVSACPRYFEAIRRDRAIVADDAVRDPLTSERASYYEQYGVVSVLDAPCRIGGRVVGVVCHEHVGETPRTWTLEEQAFVGSVADQVSLVLEGFRRREVEQVQVTLEDSLRQAQKMEAVGLLAGGVAHDLNNLLTPVLMCAEMLQEDLREQPPALDLVESIVHAALDARALVAQLLAFSRKQVLELRDLDPADEVRRTVKLLRRTLPENITIDLALDGGVVVRADAMQLQQVLLNLAINARDAMPSGGTLRISVHDDGESVRIVVEDTGIGMDEETVPHIFEPFFTTKGLSRGTGLGLSTVYGIIQQHGGAITVASTLGEGTRFEIRLPSGSGVPKSSSEIRIVSTTTTGTARGHTILVVEDEPAVRGLVIRLLGREGYHVLSAPGPEDAIRCAAAHPGHIALVLTDVVMPGMNGRKMFEEIRAARPTTQVMYMSGYDQDVLAPQGVLSSRVRLLRKPFTAADLLRSVADALRATENSASPVDKPPIAL